MILSWIINYIIPFIRWDIFMKIIGILHLQTIIYFNYWEKIVIVIWEFHKILQIRYTISILWKNNIIIIILKKKVFIRFDLFFFINIIKIWNGMYIIWSILEIRFIIIIIEPNEMEDIQDI